MKNLKHILLTAVLASATPTTFAQMTADPTTWKYEVKKKSATEYQLIFHLDLKPKWHIWSIKPGGDGTAIAPEFKFDNNAQVKLKGKITEKGKATTAAMEGLSGKFTSLSGKVDYVQNVTVKGPTKITGKHSYQVCDDKMCLPPKDKSFVFEVK